MAIDMTTVKAISYNNKDVVKIEDSLGHILWQVGTPPTPSSVIYIVTPNINTYTKTLIELISDANTSLGTNIDYTKVTNVFVKPTILNSSIQARTLGWGTVAGTSIHDLGNVARDASVTDPDYANITDYTQDPTTSINLIAMYFNRAVWATGSKFIFTSIEFKIEYTN